MADVATAGMFAPAPVTVTNTGAALSVAGQLALHGLEARQATFSYAYAFLDRTVSIGVTGKVIQGAAYNGTATVTDGEVDIADKIGRAALSTSYGIDIGAMYRPSSWLRMGVVAKDVNGPSFDNRAGREFKLQPQVRAGVAVNPWESLTVTADVDLTSNATLVPRIKSRVISESRLGSRLGSGLVLCIARGGRFSTCEPSRIERIRAFQSRSARQVFAVSL